MSTNTTSHGATAFSEKILSHIKATPAGWINQLLGSTWFIHDIKQINGSSKNVEDMNGLTCIFRLNTGEATALWDDKQGEKVNETDPDHYWLSTASFDYPPTNKISKPMLGRMTWAKHGNPNETIEFTMDAWKIADRPAFAISNGHGNWAIRFHYETADGVCSREDENIFVPVESGPLPSDTQDGREF